MEVVGVRRHIDMGLLEDDPPKTGDWVLIHVGFAMSKISEEQALDQIHTLTMLGENEAALAGGARLRPRRRTIKHEICR